MNKKLLTVAVGAALAASPMLAAQADAKFFGHAQVEISSQDSEFNTRDASNSIPNPGFDGVSVEDRARGRFGFKAKEDLGNGLKGLVHFGWRLDTSDNDARTDGGSDRPFSARETSVGIGGSFGTVRLGNLKSAYKYTGGVKYDAFVATTLEARGNGGMTGTEMDRASDGASGANGIGNMYGHNGFLANSVSYKNKFGNFGVWVTFSPDEAGSNRGSEGDWTAALKYGAGNWEVFVALVNATEDTNTGYSSTNAGGGFATRDYSYFSTKIGGKIKLGGGHTILAQFESGSLDDERPGAVATDIDLDTTFIGYQYKRGKNTFVAQIGMQEYDFGTGIATQGFNSGGTYGCFTTTGNTIDVDMITLGAIHKFSKKTRAWVGYRKTSYDGCTTGVQSGSVKDPDDTALSIGLRKDF